MGLVIPTIYATALADRIATHPEIPSEIVKISRATAVILLACFLIYVLFQTKTHDNLYGEIFEADEQRDADRHKDMVKEKLTFTECVFALVIALACVSLIAVFLVLEIPYLVDERHVSDAFVGLILIPLVEKVAGKSSAAFY